MLSGFLLTREKRSLAGKESHITSIQTPVLHGRHSCFLLEQSREMLWIFKPKFVRNFADRFVHIKDPFFGNVYQFGLDIFLGQKRLILS
jgi:hypothetical protein